MQGIYQWLLSGSDPAVIRTQLAEASGFAKCDIVYFEGIWRGVTGEFQSLVAAFAPFLDRKPSELSPVEKSILTIGAWELLREPEVPYRVAINEAVELAKSYGGTDGHKYVNGVLDKLAARARAPEIHGARIAP
jgi:transcription antitermination protein NusB